MIILGILIGGFLTAGIIGIAGAIKSAKKDTIKGDDVAWLDLPVNPYQLYLAGSEMYTVLGGELILLTPLDSSKNPEYAAILKKIKACESYDRGREEKVPCSLL